MCASSPGASFDAHPAHLTVAVSRIFSSVIFYFAVVGAVSNRTDCCPIPNPTKQISHTLHSDHLGGTGRRRVSLRLPDTLRS